MGERQHPRCERTANFYMCTCTSVSHLDVVGTHEHDAAVGAGAVAPAAGGDPAAAACAGASDVVMTRSADDAAEGSGGTTAGERRPRVVAQTAAGAAGERCDTIHLACM